MKRVLIVRCESDLSEFQKTIEGIAGDNPVQVIDLLDLLTTTDAALQFHLAIVEISLSGPAWKEAVAKLKGACPTGSVMSVYLGKYPELEEHTQKLGLAGCLFLTHEPASRQAIVERTRPILQPSPVTA